MKAIIETGGKQYYVSEGDTIFVEKLDAEAGKKVVFDKVLMVGDITGNPYVKGAKVEGNVVSHGKGKKIIVFKMKPKKNERKKQGHRQPYIKVEISSIKLSSSKEEKSEEVKEKETVAKKTTTTAKKTQTKKAEV